ncbi:hypothetical protein KFL_002150040 [Klebsormidium nitens]|uniref:Uncharacterized protein n=1 Tax=Klebsormidium nitens TaxID=105231 RepID=A0A1Y1IA44_KLENI|nr:hypothetical protein KFL_002150040 [Klebsormidium nitens]|eukprot:GAQ84968.1 hypothetical protein KFL_002150040 [Klebsormidium nitens]
METSPFVERVVRQEGKWNHAGSDFKKIWPYDEDYQISTAAPFTFSPDLPEDEQILLTTEKLRFNGAQVLPLRDGDGGRASSFMLSPPVPRSAEIDLHVDSLAARVPQAPVTPSHQADHVVAFGSAGHALKGGAAGTPSMTARTSAGPLLSSRAWKSGVQVLAKNDVPAPPGLATSYVSPDVARKMRSRVYPEVKETPSSGISHHPDFLVGVIRAECDPFTGSPFPYAEDRKHNIPWWYVPTAEEPQAEVPFYVLQVSGRVTLEQMGSIYKVPDHRQHLLMDAMNQYVLCPNTLSISVGDVISFSDEMGKIRASTTPGSSGGAVGKLGDRPLLLYGVHRNANPDEQRLCSDTEANYNYFQRPTEPHFACAYVEAVLPILKHVPAASWPAAYMVTALQEYLRAMETVLRQQNLWPVVKEFYDAQQWALP